MTTRNSKKIIIFLYIFVFLATTIALHPNPANANTPCALRIFGGNCGDTPSPAQNQLTGKRWCTDSNGVTQIFDGNTCLWGMGDGGPAPADAQAGFVNAFSSTTTRSCPKDANGKPTDCNLTYQPLEPLSSTPGAVDYADLASYLNYLFPILVTIGALIALTTFTIGGITYMVSDIADKKHWAKERIWNSVWGLLLLIASVLILNTINPDLTNFNLLKGDISCVAKGGTLGGNGSCGTVGLGTPTWNN